MKLTLILDNSNVSVQANTIYLSGPILKKRKQIHFYFPALDLENIFLSEIGS